MRATRLCRFTEAADGALVCTRCGLPFTPSIAMRPAMVRRACIPNGRGRIAQAAQADREAQRLRRLEIAAAVIERIRSSHQPDRHRPLAQADVAAMRLAKAGKFDGQTCSRSLWAIVRDILNPTLWRSEWGPPPGPLSEYPPGPLPRIVHYMPWHLTTGGAQRMLDLWCDQDARRWDVHVVTSGLRGPWRLPGATVHAEVQPRDYPALMASLEPDVVVHHNQAAPDMRADGWPQVWIVHGMPQMRKPPATGSRPAAVVVNLASDELHSAWRSLPLHVIPLGVDLQAYRPRPDDGTTRPGPDGQSVTRAPVLGFVGRLHVEKFPESFARALTRWDRGPWRLRVIGEGWRQTHQDAVRRILAGLPWIEWAGDVEPSRIPDALAGLDALIVPTDRERGETGCYSAIEAMACGLPVVARDVPGLRQSCRDGALYRVTDAELLAAVRYLDEPATRQELGRRARQVAEELHDVRVWASAHSRVYAAALRADVSILLPVYNTPARMLAEAWASIEAQTFRRWELVLVDDGSTAAEAVATIDRIAEDPRVQLLRLPANHGLSAALNAGMAQCRADLVARMDADDVMLPDRLAKQIRHMATHPECDILGAQIEVFADGSGKLISRSDHPAVVTAEHIDRQRSAGAVWYLNHPTVAFRRQKILAIGGYDPRYRVAQDLDLWERCRAAGMVIHNLPEVLVRYRCHPGQVTFRGAALLEHAQITR